jgi:hypothetical protein
MIRHTLESKRTITARRILIKNIAQVYEAGHVNPGSREHASALYSFSKARTLV